MNTEQYLRELMELKSGSVKAFSELVNLPYTTVRSILQRGILNAKMDNVIKIANGLGIPPEKIAKFDGSTIADIQKVLLQLEKPRQQKVYDYASTQLDEQNNVIKFPESVDEDKSNYDLYSDIQIYGAASAGLGEILMDEHSDTVSYHGYVPKHDYALIVNGDSMQPLFADQQVIFVDKSEEAYNGQIVIAYLNGNAYVKKLWVSEDKCELISLNPKYEPIEITDDDDFRIDGVVVL